mgnify:CR=1 FL=1
MKDVNLLLSNGVDVNKALELFGDMDMYNNTLTDFLNEVFNRIERIKKFKEISDMANYAIEVHALKSDSKYFGFTTLAELSYNHEMASKQNNMFYVMDHYDELINEANRIISIVQQYMGQEVTVAQPTSQTTNNIEIKDKTILVVDDSNVTRNFVQKIFSNNFNVLVATNGDEAISIIDNNLNNKIVAVLLDLNMPGLNGFDVLDHFKNKNLFSLIPVSIITSDNSKETRDKVFAYGVIDILVKPFNERDVKMVLDKTIYFNDQL